MQITPDLLRSATGCTQERAVVFATALDEGCIEYEINTPNRLAHFLAQVGHESGALADVKERWGPTPAQLRYERESGALAYVKEIWGGTPAQLRYEGRADLGNDRPGDGERFCGRGLLQTTGRANYRSLRDRLRARGIDAPDFEAAPVLLEHPKWAVLSACDYWGMRDINRLADAGDFVGVTKAVNGGINGIDDRRRRLERASAVLNATQPVPQLKPPPESALKEKVMAIPAVLMALLPSLIEQIPKLGKLFGSGSQVSERNIAAATTVMELVQTATSTPNAQAAVEAIASNPAVREQATQAIEAAWFTLTEGGGGGIEGARKADAAAMNSDGPWWTFLRSPSFWMLVLTLPMVYIIVGSIAGLWGYVGWSDDVRASLATAVVSLIVGGASGYFWGQTTSRNRTPAP